MRVKYFNLICCGILLFVSCAHNQLAGNLYSFKELKLPKEHFDFHDSQNLKQNLEKLGSLKNKKNQWKLVQTLSAFLNIKRDLRIGQINLMPNSASSIELSSFCAASDKATPDKEEVFKWVKGQPNIPLVRSLTELYSNSPKADQTTYQEIFWNLSNEINYEDYPIEQKDILNRASDKSKFVLPSKLKTRVIQEILPSEVSDILDIVKGKYYTYQEFSSIITNRKSNMALSVENTVSSIAGSSLYTTTKSDSFRSQKITFYNPSDKRVLINIFDYYLAPMRQDVQPIIIAGVITNMPEVEKTLEVAAIKMLGYLASQYPTLNSAEKQLVKSKPIESAIAFYYAHQAESLSEQHYPDSSVGGKADALRHFLWSGYLIRELGETTAREFLEAHEQSFGQPYEQKEMDEYNNERGIKTADQLLKEGSCSDSDLLELGKSLIDKHELKTLKKAN